MKVFATSSQLLVLEGIISKKLRGFGIVATYGSVCGLLCATVKESGNLHWQYTRKNFLLNENVSVYAEANIVVFFSMCYKRKYCIRTDM